jgi:hypothetical protein
MGIGCISPDPVTQASKNRIAQAPRWLKINDGSTTMLAQEPWYGGSKQKAFCAQALQNCCWHWGWVIGCISPDPVTQASKNIIAQAPRWLKINDGSRSMMAQEQCWLKNQPGPFYLRQRLKHIDLIKDGSQTSRLKKQGGSRTRLVQ